MSRTDTILDDMMRRQQEAAAERRAEWQGGPTDIPDLDFYPPDCPICYLMTDFDDGWFTCKGCDISWPDNGYGSQACRADGSKIASPIPTPVEGGA